MRTRLLLIATILTMVTTSQAQAQLKPCVAQNFFASSNSLRLHFAFKMMGCTEAAMDACNIRALEMKEDCEYRGEDGGTTYSSCKCQSVRYARDCYENAGCYTGSALFMELSPECFGIQ